MGIAERKKREKQERRSLILRATKKLILDKGVDSVSMQDIADATELSKATLYLYFESKEAILWEILDDAARYFVSYVQERVAPASNGLEAVRALWESYLSLFGSSTDILVLTGIAKYVDSAFFADEEEPPPSKRNATWQIRATIEDVLGRGIADGSLDPSTEPGQVARMVMIIATALVDNIARRPRKERDGRVIREELRSTFELFLRGLAAEGTDRSLLVLSTE